MKLPTLDVGELFLRGYSAEDFEEFAALFGNPEVMQHADGVLSVAQAATLFRSLTVGQEGSEPRAWAVMDRPTQGLAGHAALKPSPDGHEQELNIVLLPRFRQKGNGAAIGAVLINLAFQAADCAAVTATVDREHAVALALAKSLGFMPVSMERDLQGEYILLKIMRDQWQARQ